MRLGKRERLALRAKTGLRQADHDYRISNKTHIRLAWDNMWPQGKPCLDSAWTKHVKPSKVRHIVNSPA